MNRKRKWQAGGGFIARQTTDQNFEHCARTMLPLCIEVIKTLRPGNIITHNIINCISIPAEVAAAFALERYGKPRFRVAALNLNIPPETAPPMRDTEEGREDVGCLRGVQQAARCGGHCG